MTVQKNTQLSFWWFGGSISLLRIRAAQRLSSRAAFPRDPDAKYRRANAFWFFLSTTMVLGGPNTFSQEKHQHFHVDRHLVKGKEIKYAIKLTST